MPIYDYTCGACGRVTEVIHGINDQGPRFCPNCGAEGRMRKALSAPAVLFKGSGWAKVDRRSASGGSSAGRSASKSTPAPRGGGSGSSDSSATSGSGAAEASSGQGGAASSGDGGGAASSSDGGGD